MKMSSKILTVFDDCVVQGYQWDKRKNMKLDLRNLQDMK